MNKTAVNTDTASAQKAPGLQNTDSYDKSHQSTDSYSQNRQSTDSYGSSDRRSLALVTGASRGIGAAIARTLAENGYDLILTCSKTMDALEQLSAQLQREYGVLVTAVQCDMGSSRDVRDLFTRIDHLDVLINNAGIAYIGLLQDMSDSDWDRMIATDLSACFYTCRAAIPIFLQRHTGRIINISSVWGNVGAACEAAYSAAKGGVNSLTRALAKELAPSGISVNAIACGCVDTVMNGQLSEDEKNDLAQEIPAGRFADPSEIADTVLRLLQAPLYLTGQIITVDGGWI